MNSRYTRALTPREQEVIELLSTGLTNEEIARQLDISLDGVKYHVSGILRRLRVENRREAASLHLGTEGGVLTPRELEVIELLSTGLTNEEIARQLGISLDGVKYHVSGILRRLDVGSRREAASLHLRTEGGGRFAAWAPMMFLRKLPLPWLPKAAAGAVLTATAAGIALLAWGVLSTSSDAVTTTGCTSVEQSATNAASCAPGVVQAPVGADAVTAISAGGGHNCALKVGGVWCWGLNSEGQLGNDSTSDSAVPVAVPGLSSGVSTISAGASETCALKDSAAWCWGRFDFAALGDGGTTQSHVPVAVAYPVGRAPAISRGCAIKDGGLLCRSLYDSATVPLPVPGLESGVSATDGNCAVKDGAVWCLGWNEDGRVPSASPVSGLASGITAISGVCAIKGGGVWCWGFDDPASIVPAAVPGLESGVTAISTISEERWWQPCALKDGGVWCWEFLFADGSDAGITGIGAPVPVSGLANGVSAIAGSCALKEGGVWCWGSNSNGQLGNNTPADSYSPVPVAVQFPLASASGSR